MTKEQNKTDIRATPCNPFERKFDVAAGTLWNSLPAGLQNEQSLEALKIYYAKTMNHSKN
jgi:hypothetical protein